MQGSVFGDQACAGLAQAKPDCREHAINVSPEAAGGLVLPELNKPGTAPTSDTAQQAAMQTAPLNAWRSPLPAYRAAVETGSDPTVCLAISTLPASLDDPPCGLVAETTADAVQPSSELACSQSPRGLSASFEAAAAAETCYDWETLSVEAKALAQALPSPSAPPTETPVMDPDTVSVTWRIL